uniref:C2H2-type domain-containing protein n=1 Tax=Glossina austeni TaxID=7395 RepID=A0A1A9UKY3_GLOAU
MFSFRRGANSENQLEGKQRSDTCITNAPGVPVAICGNCGSTLKIVYAFMKNAFRAQEILKRKLQEMRKIKCIMQRRQKGKHQQCPSVESKKSKQFRCKVCDVKLEKNISLKKHVNLHLDLIVYKCQVRTYESRGRICWSEHYLLEHNLRATAEQLKPKILSSLEVQKESYIHENPQMNENTERHSYMTSNPMSTIISTNEVQTSPKQKMTLNRQAEIVQSRPSSEITSNDMAMTQTTDQAWLAATSVKQPAHVATGAERSID